MTRQLFDIRDVCNYSRNSLVGAVWLKISPDTVCRLVSLFSVSMVTDPELHSIVPDRTSDLSSVVMAAWPPLPITTWATCPKRGKTWLATILTIFNTQHKTDDSGPACLLTDNVFQTCVCVCVIYICQ